MATIISIVLTSVFTAVSNRNLTYKAWVPFNYSYPALYFLVYTHQLIGMATSGIVNVACESVICGLLLHICCQLEILEYRLTKMTHGEDVLRDCVSHHNRIFEYAYTVNDMFAKIIGLQFAVSMLVVCSNLYRIAMATDYVTFISLMMYTGAILTQIFIYCWFGNEVKAKSLQLNNIYNIQWPSLSNSSKKGLLIVMRRAMNPIEFSSAYIITMNLESFVAFMNIILNVDNSDELTDSLYMMLTVFIAGYKNICLWIDRKNVRMLVNVLHKKPFEPNEFHEITVRQQFDKRIQNVAMRYLTLVGSSVLVVTVSSIFMDFSKGNLTYKAWIPFDYSTPIAFTFVYTNQMIGMSCSGLVNVACESLVCGFLLHICCQFEILEYRLKNINQNQNILRDCINHHNYIVKYAQTINDKFAKIIAVQFAVTVMVVCSNLYRMAMTTEYMKFVPLIVYTGCMLAQIFIYCWFGNEVKLKSLQLANSVYNMNWLKLSNSSKKGLLIIMKRSTIPIEFSSAYIITMNLGSFVALLKMSYSSFNLLHQTEEQ
ncbi:PREDICTED: odorant receptor 46a-like [Trachymyrmex cornetzi]|uniref:odorant receptor 46a-like n=1 Tax=Trachymyrmex cornetzi TaxID=471704 RepID=UPI00084F02AD|nr:PREDICTED: odorant receptor 46a-like [Trachymyrmex cornetzi]